MGGTVSKETFDSELAKAKTTGVNVSYDVSLGRDFTDKTEQARDPKCVWARLNGAPVARIRLGRSVNVHDLVTLYGPDGEETAHDVTQDMKTGKLEMERHTIRGTGADELHPSFVGLKIFYGDYKWRIVPVSASRGGELMCNAMFLVVEDHAKGAVDPKKIVGFIKVQDFNVSEFILSNRFTSNLVGAVLYVLTRVCNGALKVPGEKGK